MTQPSTTSCTARSQAQCAWFHGRVMGGSSSLNYMLYMRGNSLDYDEWALLGNPGWSFKEVLPYFLKSEDNKNIDLLDPQYHSTGGYQSVSLHTYQDENIFPLINAFKELGLPEIDQNAGSQIGVMLGQGIVNNGRRVSTNDAFIKPIRNTRNNLNILTNANVVRVLIDPQTKKAYGVEYIRDKTQYTVLAKKEVIVSAGAINGPKVLMLSGIGPSKHLESHGIEVLQDLPVGYNLQDHTTFDGLLFALNKSSTMVDDSRRNADLHYYIASNRGSLSSSALLQISAMVQTKYAIDPRQEIQYMFEGANVYNFFTDPILAAETNINAMAYYDGIMVRPILLNPQSRGIIMLNDSDPINGTPLIYANTFTETIDLLRLIEGAKHSVNLVATESLQNLEVRLVDSPLPACAGYQFGSDEYWGCIIQSYTNTIHHPVGTCKMGPRNDKTAVVDARLRVHGISNLRVIDASIMPIITRGNTNAPTIMIGEKGSDFIKQDWLNHQSNEERGYYEVAEILEEKWDTL